MKGSTLTLKKFKKKWTKEFYQNLSINQVHQYLDIPVNSFFSFEEWLKNMEWLVLLGDAYHWIAFNQENKMIGGIIAHRLTEEENIVEIGTWISRDNWGRGYNIRIKNEAAKFLFEMHHVEQIILFVQDTNQRAIAALQKIPYVKRMEEGELKHTILSYWKWKEFKLGIPLLLFQIKKEDFF